MTLTPRQSEALDLIRGARKKTPPRHVLLVGGARSGKTSLALHVMVVRAVKYPGSRHIAARLRFNHAKVSLWMDSLPKVLAATVPRGVYELDNANYRVVFWNGSEIWIDGLDSDARMEKILGREYTTTFTNEVSQIGWDQVGLLRTRLAQVIPGCRPFALYDCNPPSFRHWTYRVFVDGVDPETGDPLPNPEAYRWIRMNPRDNEQNLPQGYIEAELAHLPPRKRRRFYEGEWSTDVEGQVFDTWDEVTPNQVPAGRESFGMDFGFTIDPSTVVRAVLHGDDLYLQELFYQTHVSTFMLGEAIKSIEDGGLIRKAIWADSADPRSISELQKMGLIVVPARKSHDSIRAGIDWIKSKRLHIVSPSPNLKAELYEYRYLTSRDGKVFPVPVDDFNHAIDAARYACEDWMAGRHAGTVKIGAA